MLNFDTRLKNSDATQPRVTNVKTPIVSAVSKARGTLQAWRAFASQYSWLQTVLDVT